MKASYNEKHGVKTMEKSNVENVKVENENNGGINENLSENENVYAYFGSDALMSFNGETDEEDNAWEAMNEHGNKMRKEAEKANVNVKKLLAKLTIESLENAPGTLHDLSSEIIHGKRRKDIGKMNKNDVEKILFFHVLPELGKISMIKRKSSL